MPSYDREESSTLHSTLIVFINHASKRREGFTCVGSCLSYKCGEIVSVAECIVPGREESEPFQLVSLVQNSPTHLLQAHACLHRLPSVQARLERPSWQLPAQSTKEACQFV